MEKNLSPLRAIRIFCATCNGEVKGGKKYDCLDKNCVFYPWKEGKGTYEFPDTIPQSHKDYIKSLKNPVKKQQTGRVMTEEHKAKIKAALAKAREAKKTQQE